MRTHWSLVVLATCAAILPAGCASSGAKTGPAKPGSTAAQKPAPAAAKPVDAKASPAPATKAPETKPVAPATQAKPGDAKAPDTKAPDTKAAPATAKTPDLNKPPESKAPPAGAKTAAPAGSGMWASYDDYMKRTGAKLQESKFLGLRIRPKLSEELDYTDNAFYQDAGEQVVVDRSPFGGPVANPKLGTPRGKVSEIVNDLMVGVDLDLQLNSSLVPLVGQGQETVHAVGASVTSVQYLKNSDSPDALNYDLHLDLPALINDLLSRLKQIDATRNSFYARLEGDWSRTTDPLDVARFQVNSTAPTFTNGGSRSSFSRNEWFLKATLGWKGPIFDAKLSYDHYRMTLGDTSLKSADHVEQTAYSELGYRLLRSEHRIYGFYEYTRFNFDDRGNFDPNDSAGTNIAALRDFGRIRTGLGWEGPISTKKIHGGAELYYLTNDVYHPGPFYTHPQAIDLHTGQVLTNSGNGNIIYQSFDSAAGVAGKANVSYRPFVTKGTQLQAEYSRNLDWSVVGQDKMVDKGSITFTHPINEKLTGEVSYNVSMENVAFREKRLYNELGVGVRYKLAAYTEGYLRYTIRHMRSRREPVTVHEDGLNREYLVQANGDFTANILALGISIAF
jgi:hypothetical protein